MANIFLSYCREDQAAAKAIAKLLEGAGHAVWWDHQIVSGHEFSSEIEAALERADLVLVAWSEASVRSPWVRDEAAIGRDSGRLLPILLDAQQPPMGFRQFQAFDLSKWNRRSTRGAAEAFVAAIDARLSDSPEKLSLGGPETSQASKKPFYGNHKSLFALTAITILIAITAWLALSPGRNAERPIVAVLPFSDLSPSRDKAFLAEGVAEEILSALGKNPDIRVLGRSSSWALRGAAAQPSEFRKTFGVTHLLEGSIRTAGPELRLNVRLVGTKDGTQQWTEEYRGKADDIFALQDRAAAAVSARLNATSLRAPRLGSHAAMTSADAYNMYLAARQIARTRTEPELRRSYILARKVVAAQPNFSRAHALLAELVFMLSDDPNSYGTIPVEKARPIAESHAKRAIILAPELADGYAAMGLVGQPETAIRDLRHAIKLDPARSEILLWLALRLQQRDEYPEAIKALRKAAAIDPLFPAVINRLAIDLSSAGRVDEAAQAIEQFSAQGGDKAQAARFRTIGSLYKGDLSEVIRSGEEALRLNPDIPYVRMYVRQAYWQLGMPSKAAATPPSSTQSIRNAFFGHGYDAAIAAAPKAPPAAWRRHDVDFYIFALGATRNWNTLAALFDARPTEAAKLCYTNRRSVLPLVVALDRLGRSSEARELLNCLNSQFRDAKLAGPRDPYGLDKAQIFALSGKPDQAVATLKATLRTGWYAPSVRLSDFPAFDSLAGRPDFVAIQARLNRWIALEAHESRRFRVSSQR